MGGTSLQLRAREHIADDILQALETVVTDETYPADTALIKSVQHLAPAKGTLSRLVEDAENLSGLVLPHRQDYVECLSVHAPLPVDLDVHAVDEHHRVITLQRPLQPFRHLAQIIQHPRYARLAVMFP